MSKGIMLLCAGGTGGHLFPAEAVAHELVARGYEVHLAADERVERFSSEFPATKIHTIKSATFGSKNPIAMLKAGWTLMSGYRQSRKLIQNIKPIAVAGFGGYPTVPPLLAASQMGVPSLVHEANAVLGRANKLLTKRVLKTAIGFGETDGGSESMRVTGNPVRPPVIEAANIAYSSRGENEPFNLLVFGGSQGAAFFGEIIPEALKLLPEAQLKNMRLIQQARPEDEDQVRNTYNAMGVESEVRPFFNNMAEKIGYAHLVISRAGASTVSELAVIGRPAFLVPYPHALDHDQANNAATVAAEGGAVIFQQAALRPQLLADELSRVISDPKKLALMAKNAKKTGKPDAAQILADMLEALAQQKQN